MAAVTPCELLIEPSSPPPPPPASFVLGDPTGRGPRVPSRSRPERGGDGAASGSNVVKERSPECRVLRAPEPRVTHSGPRAPAHAAGSLTAEGPAPDGRAPAQLSVPPTPEPQGQLRTQGAPSLGEEDR